MKSRLIALLTAFTLAVTLAACGDSGKEAADKAAAAAKDSQMKAQAAAKDASDKAAAASKDAAAATLRRCPRRRRCDEGRQQGRRLDGAEGLDGAEEVTQRHAATKNAGFAPAFFFAACRKRQPDFGAA